MTITTKTGKVFECDLAVENPSPQRLYLHILGATRAEVSATFTDITSALPIEGYPGYTALQAIVETPSGIKVTLKKGEQ